MLEEEDYLALEPTEVEAEINSLYGIGAFRRLLFQLEIAPTTGTVHWQAYLETNSVINTAHAMSSDLLRRFNWIRANGSPKDNYKYCTKEDTRLENPVEYPADSFQRERLLLARAAQAGAGQGHRSDLVSYAAAIRSGKTDLELLEEFPASYIRYGQAINRAREACISRRMLDNPPEVIMIIGPPNTGKSHYARERWPEAYWCPMPNNDKLWMGGYQGHKVVIFDDFRDSWMRMTAWLQMCGNYPFQVESKGLSHQFVAETMVFTTNKHPKNWWKRKTEQADWDQSPVRSRISEYIYRIEPYIGPGQRRMAHDPYLWDGDIPDVVAIQNADGYTWDNVPVRAGALGWPRVGMNQALEIERDPPRPVEQPEFRPARLRRMNARLGARSIQEIWDVDAARYARDRRGYE